MFQPEKYIPRYKDLYFQRFGKTISDAEAYDQFASLFLLLKTIFKTIPKNISGVNEQTGGAANVKTKKPD